MQVEPKRYLLDLSSNSDDSSNERVEGGLSVRSTKGNLIMDFFLICMEYFHARWGYWYYENGSKDDMEVSIQLHNIFKK